MILLSLSRAAKSSSLRLDNSFASVKTLSKSDRNCSNICGLLYEIALVNSEMRREKNGLHRRFGRNPVQPPAVHSAVVISLSRAHTHYEGFHYVDLVWTLPLPNPAEAT